MDIRIPPADLSMLQYATYSGPEAVPLREGYSHRVRKGRCGKVAAFERVSASNSPPQPLELRSGGPDINKNIAKPPHQGADGVVLVNNNRLMNQHHPVCAG